MGQTRSPAHRFRSWIRRLQNTVDQYGQVSMGKWHLGEQP
jgi:hypothetical protein